MSLHRLILTVCPQIGLYSEPGIISMRILRFRREQRGQEKAIGRIYRGQMPSQSCLKEASIIKRAGWCGYVIMISQRGTHCAGAVISVLVMLFILPFLSMRRDTAREPRGLSWGNTDSD